MGSELSVLRRKYITDATGRQVPGVVLVPTEELLASRSRVAKPKRKTKSKTRSTRRRKTTHRRSATRSGWSKTKPAGERRKAVLRAHKGNLLSSARSKQALANVTKDAQTKRLAQADATYFYREYRKSKEVVARR